MSKPRAGACGICGTAVVVPDEATVAAKFTPSPGLYNRTDRNWVDGHLYEMDDRTGKPRLRRVRCHKHADANDGDPRTRRAGEWW